MSKLLIVDDEFRIRELIKKYALYEGHEVDEAEDGRQAVLKCRNNTYDLIIMDIMMPVLDGFGAVEQIRKFSNTPIIMLSARGEEYDRLSGFESGVDDYVVKPFSPKELMMRAAAVLRRAGNDKNEDSKS
ncbi:MAG: response regulator, partial [Ruminococcus sp.]|nr:response regulator [Ruminococcus sp.]